MNNRVFTPSAALQLGHVVPVEISYQYLEYNINSEDVLHVFSCLSKADKVIKKDKPRDIKNK